MKLNPSEQQQYSSLLKGIRLQTNPANPKAARDIIPLCRGRVTRHLCEQIASGTITDVGKKQVNGDSNFYFYIPPAQVVNSAQVIETTKVEDATQAAESGTSN